MKEIFVARKAFAAVLVSCAVARSAIDLRLGRVRKTEHEPARGERVLDRVPLTQELRAPAQHRLLADGRQLDDALREPLRRADRHRRLADDERGAPQEWGQALDGTVQV
jgi:hypothetical protein